MAWKHRITNIDIENRTADCSTCGKVSIHKKGGGQYRCATNAKAAARVNRFKDKYSLDITVTDVPTNCEVCGGSTRIAYDHDHTTGKHRGWLCMKCNTALGLVNDDIEILHKLIMYLQQKTIAM